MRIATDGFQVKRISGKGVTRRVGEASEFGAGECTHKNPGREAGIHAGPSAASPTEIVYHQIPLP
jgi:hypothetical protein